MHFCFVEDDLHQVVVYRVCDYLGRIVPRVVCQGGKSKIVNQARLRRLDHSSGACQFFILVDLDHDSTCAPQEKRRILSALPATTQLKLVIAVREAESWLLADKKGLATFLSVAEKRLPLRPEDESNPKRSLVNIARRSRRRVIREAIVPMGTASQGPQYNSTIRDYVYHRWNVEAAKDNSASLAYFCRILEGNLPPALS